MSFIEHGGGFLTYDNEDMEVDHTETTDLEIPQNMRLHERLFLRKAEKLITPNYTAKKKWEPLEEQDDIICHTAPLEQYMTCSPQRLMAKFVSDLVIGDIIIGEVMSQRRNQFELKVIALDGGQARNIPILITLICDIAQVIK